MKKFTQKFVGLFALLFAMSFTVNAQDYGCMDSNYAEFNENANTDDGSCSCPVSVELNISNASCNLTDGTAHVSGLECSVETIEATTAPTVEITITEEFIVTEEFITSNSYLLNSCISNNDGIGGGSFMILSSGPDNSLIIENFNDEICSDNQYWIDNNHPLFITLSNGDSYSFEFYGNSIETCYAWTNSEGVVLSNQESVSNLSAGTYTFTYTHGECSYSDSFEVVSCIYFGCMDSSAVNYDESANTDDGSCVAVVHGCTDANAFNYNAAANTLDDSCVPLVYGCTDASAFNFDSSSNTDDGSCVPVILGCTDGSAFNYNTDANTDDGSCNSFTFHNGWSLFGYTCLESQNVGEAFSVISESIEIVKDEWGLSYLPAWGFSAFENLEFGEGYQIKLIEDVINFQFCEVIIPEDGIGPSDVDAAYESGYTDGVASVTPEDGITQTDVDQAIADVHYSYEGFISPSYGCIDSEACNFNSNANINDGSCNYPNENYDCNGNIDVEIGDEAFGGIVFKINGDGTGLVADLVDLCSSCQHNTAVALCANSEAQGYNDWYLPSYGIVEDMMETIGGRTVGGVDLPNYGNFSYNSGEPYYWWSSSETTPQFGSGPVFWVVHGFNSHSTYQGPWSWYRTRAVRAFP